MSSLAETAQLVVALKLKDEMSSSLSHAKGELGGLSQSAHSTATGSFARLQSSAAGVGGALKHAGQQMKNLAMGFGIGAGIVGGASIVGFFEQGIAKARDFGSEVTRMAKLTGMSIPATSALASALEHFGIGADTAMRSIGFLEKNVGLLTTSGKDAEFTRKFGFALRDTTVSAGQLGKALDVLKDKHASAAEKVKAHALITKYDSGQIKDANALLLQAADYFNNKTIPATTKAAALSKLFGRSWQELIPVLSAGSEKIKAAADEAQRLGLTLTQSNIDDLAKLKNQTRDWNTALGGLQLQLGLLLVGPLTDLTKAATNFISDPGNRRSILGFFTSVLDTAKTVGGVLANTVIPTIQGLAGTAKAFWDGIPGPLRDLLLKAAAGDRIIKFAFGFSPIEMVGSGLKGLIGGLFQRGGSPANPMWVATVGGGLGGGVGEAGGGLLAKGAGLLGISTGTLLAGIGITAIAAAAVAAVAIHISGQNSDLGHGIRDNLAPNIAGKSSAEIASALAGVRQGIHDLESNPLTVLVRGDALDSLHQMEAALTERQNNATVQSHNVSERTDKLASPAQVLSRLSKLGIDLNAIHKTQLSNLSAVQHVDADTRHAGGVTAAALGRAAADARHGVSVTGANLSRLRADTRHAGNVTAGRLNTANAKLESIRRKKTDFHVTVPVTVNTSVSVRDIGKKFATSNRLGSRMMLQAAS